MGEAGSCEAARRALLSQGYIITSSDANQVAGNKSFQQNAENHLQISFNITCVPDSNDEQRSTIFANALQDRYALKKSNTSASVGVGVLGSLSMPIGSTDDSMVKVASETVSSPQFYDRYFALVENYLPKPRTSSRLEPQAEAPKAQQPAQALGLPEPAGLTPANPPAAAAAPVSPVQAVPQSSVEPAPVQARLISRACTGAYGESDLGSPSPRRQSRFPARGAAGRSRAPPGAVSSARQRRADRTAATERVNLYDALPISLAHMFVMMF